MTTAPIKKVDQIDDDEDADGYSDEVENYQG